MAKKENRDCEERKKIRREGEDKERQRNSGYKTARSLWKEEKNYTEKDTRGCKTRKRMKGRNTHGKTEKQ